MNINYKELLINKLVDRTAKVAVVGLGYVGLPLAVTFANAGFTVTGIDLDPRKIDAIQRGESYIPDVPAETVARLVQTGKLSAAADFAALKEVDAVSICVPTPLRKTGDPDMSYIISATEQLARYVHPGMIIVLESTTYPGTTREILLPRLGVEKGLTVGVDFFLAFSPERVDPGAAGFHDFKHPEGYWRDYSRLQRSGDHLVFTGIAKGCPGFFG